MKRETIGQILARIDRAEERPLPATASRFDVSRAYRVVSGDDIEYADTLNDAKYVAGEWQIERERVVEIVKQRGIPKRWAAHPVWNDGELDIQLHPLFADPSPEDVGSRRQQALAKHIDRERRRQRRKVRRRQQLQEQKKRAAEAHRFSEGVVCISTHPPKPFKSVVDAAAWAGVKQPTLARAIKRGYRCGEFEFRQAGEILKEQASGNDVPISLVRAATEALRLSRRKSGVPEQRRQLPGEAHGDGAPSIHAD